MKNYYNKNILSFGDNLHKIHPLAGQGLNMTIRDIKILCNLIDQKIDLGLPLDKSLLKEFENKTKHFNYIYASSIDFIHEFFKFDNKDILGLSEAYKEIFATKNLTDNINKLNGSFKDNPLVKNVIDFIVKDKKRSICTPFS